MHYTHVFDTLSHYTYERRLVIFIRAKLSKSSKLLESYYYRLTLACNVTIRKVEEWYYYKHFDPIGSLDLYKF